VAVDPAVDIHGNPVPPRTDRTPWALFNRGINSQFSEEDDNRFMSLVRDSAFNPAGYSSVFNDPHLGPGAKAAYVAGRFTHDLLTDGSRVPYWALNHPLAVTSFIGESAVNRAGLAPDYKAERRVNPDLSRGEIDDAFAKAQGFSTPSHLEGVPLGVARYAIPALAAATMMEASGNHNLLNAFGGGRPAGFEAIIPTEGDSRVSANPALEGLYRYLFGRTGRLLPWEQFSAERPDVSPQDFQAYQAYQFDKGPLGIGLFKGTDRNIDGEPEVSMMGFRVPLSAAAATSGSLIGAVAGANELPARISQELPGMKAVGHRRLAGAMLGGILGALSGEAGGQAVNNLVIQPLINPEAVAAKAQWQQQQRAAGLL
jgi:hypothetical protein